MREAESFPLNLGNAALSPWSLATPCAPAPRLPVAAPRVALHTRKTLAACDDLKVGELHLHRYRPPKRVRLLAPRPDLISHGRNASLYFLGWRMRRRDRVSPRSHRDIRWEPRHSLVAAAQGGGSPYRTTGNLPPPEILLPYEDREHNTLRPRTMTHRKCVDSLASRQGIGESLI